MQETNVYVYLVPVALIFIAAEIFFSWYYKRGYISFSEAIANLGTALANQTTNVLLMAGVYVIYGYLWENFRIFTIEINVWTSCALFLSVDFVFYWIHRFGHSINILWAAHSPHHSAEEMNFFVAVRASVTQRLSSFLFFWVLTIIGFQPIHIYTMTGLHLFIAFLHHTEFVPKLWRPIEFIFTTPSHHRVHHGVNLKYLDKNFGEFLIIWDRIFGSFAEENEKVVYGIFDHPKSTNPISINFHFYIILWFMPAGWRPRGLEVGEKVEITQENQVKFRPPMFANAKLYLVLQAISAIVLMMFVIGQNFWTVEQRWIGAALLWWQIINWSGILEAKQWLFVSENLRIVFATLIIWLFSGYWQMSPITLGLLATSVFSIIWVNMFFRPNVAKLVNA
jgi:alkylglycerol monooxygenase